MSHIDHFQYLPTHGFELSQWSGAAQTTLDGSGDGIGWVFQMPTTDTITHLGYVCASIASPPVYRISLQGATDWSTPDGVTKNGTDGASATFTPVAGTFTWAPIDFSYAATGGEILSVVILYESGTIGASNNATFRHSLNNATNHAGMPTVSTTTTGGSSWVQVASDFPAYVGVRTATGRYLWPIEDELTQSLTGLSTGDRIAGKLTLPAGFPTLTCRGVRLRGQRTFSSAQSVKVGVWNGAGTELESVTLTNGDEWETSTSTYTKYLFDGTFDVAAETPVYIGLEHIAGSGATQLRLTGFTFDTAADQGDFALGTNVIKSTWDGASWTDDDTVRMQVDLIPESQASGGGGGPMLVQRRKVR